MSIFVVSNNTFYHNKNRIMRKNLKSLTFSVVFFSLLGLSSCGNDDPVGPTEPAEPAEPTVLAPPTDLRVDNITAFTATLSWIGSADAELYEIAWGDKSLLRYTLSYNLKDLDPATEYEWKIRTKNRDLYSEWVDGPKFTTKTPPHWAGLEGTWTVTEDVNSGGTWYNNQTSTIIITGDLNDETKIKIDGFAPYDSSGKGHTIYATVVDMKMTLLSQELTPGWDMPNYRTYFASLVTGTFANDAGKNFPVASITKNASDKYQISLLGGLSPYSYFVYDLETATSGFAGAYLYVRNTKWVQQ